MKRKKKESLIVVKDIKPTDNELYYDLEEKRIETFFPGSVYLVAFLTVDSDGTQWGKGTICPKRGMSIEEVEADISKRSGKMVMIMTYKAIRNNFITAQRGKVSVQDLSIQVLGSLNSEKDVCIRKGVTFISLTDFIKWWIKKKKREGKIEYVQEFTDRIREYCEYMSTRFGKIISQQEADKPKLNNKGKRK